MAIRLSELQKGKKKEYPESGKVTFYDDESIDPRWSGFTKSGEKFDETKKTAAILPKYWNKYKGKTFKVTNPRNNKSVKVKVNDTGGFGKYGKILDLSKSAFESISDTDKGVGNFKIEVLKEPITYKVKKGDTLSGIAKEHGTTVKKLQEENDIKDPDKIQAGETIDIAFRKKRTPRRREGTRLDKIKRKSKKKKGIRLENLKNGKEEKVSKPQRLENIVKQPQRLSEVRKEPSLFDKFKSFISRTEKKAKKEPKGFTGSAIVSTDISNLSKELDIPKEKKIERKKELSNIKDSTKPPAGFSYKDVETELRAAPEDELYWNEKGELKKSANIPFSEELKDELDKKREIKYYKQLPDHKKTDMRLQAFSRGFAPWAPKSTMPAYLEEGFPGAIVTGKLASLALLASGSAPMVPKITKTLSPHIPLSPTFFRMIPHALQRATIWGGKEFIDQSLKLAAGDSNVKNAIKKTASDVGFGLLSGGIHGGIINTAGRIISQGVGRGSWVAAEKLLKDHDLSTSDLKQVAFSAGLGVALESINARAVSRAYKQADMQNFFKNKLVSRLMSTKGYSREQAKQVSKLLNLYSRGFKKPAAVQALKKVPKTFAKTGKAVRKLPKNVYYKYINETAKNISSGSSSPFEAARLSIMEKFPQYANLLASTPEDLKDKSYEGLKPGEEPRSDPNSYEFKNIKKETKEDIEQVEKESKDADVPAIKSFQKISDKFKTNIDKLLHPQKDVVKDAVMGIEKWRAETNKAGLYADWAKKSLYKIEDNKKNLEIIDRYLDNPSEYREDFGKLPTKDKNLARELKKEYNELHRMAQNEGILEAYKENYTPHLYTNSKGTLKKMLYPEGGRLGKRFRFGKQRKFETMDEAEEAGLDPITDPIAKSAIYKHQLYRTIANRNLIQTLKQVKNEEGMPLIMGKPRKKDKLRVWENDYEWVNAPGLQRYMYVGEAEGKPMLVKTPAKADPELAKALERAFAPWAKRSKISKFYRLARGRVKRVIMLNPLIHSWNIASDVFDEVNYNPYSTAKVFKRGKKLYKKQDEMVERAVEAGLALETSYETSVDLRKDLMKSSEKWARKQGVKWSPLRWAGKLEKFSDRVLWGNIVKSAQLGLFETLTKKMSKEQPKWSQDKIDRTTAKYINVLLGTIPTSWFSKLGREGASISFFSRNWTLSNLDMVTKALTGGRKGLGTAGMKPDEQRRIGKNYAKHLAKGILGLLALSNLVQLAMLYTTNKMKKHGIIDGAKSDIHLTFSNGPDHWYDIDTGLKDKEGQKIYLVAPFFRYIRDYIGWVTKPLKTAYNKLEPLLRTSFETLANYSVWKRKQIRKPGAPAWNKIKDGVGYFVKGISPSSYVTSRPGEVKTKFEWLVPFTGTWIRHGPPGGKYTDVLFKFREEHGYTKDKLDNRIDELLQQGKFKKAEIMMNKSGRYSTEQGKEQRILRFIAPLNYYYRNMSKKEKEKFKKWIKERGYNLKEIQKALTEERMELKKRIQQQEDKFE